MEYFKNSRPDQRIEKRDIPQNAFAADSAHTGVSVAIATSMRHKRGITGAGAAASGSPARVALRRQFPQLVYNVSRPGRLAPLTPPAVRVRRVCRRAAAAAARPGGDVLGAAAAGAARVALFAHLAPDRGGRPRGGDSAVLTSAAGADKRAAEYR